MVISAISFLLLPGIAPRQRPAPAKTTVQINVTLDPRGKKISPYIYGVNNEHDPSRLKRLGATVNRLGGTPWSTFNGAIRSANSGDDYYFHNYDSIADVPIDPAGFLQRTASVGGTAMLTVPLLNYISKDDHSYSFAVSKYGGQENVLEGQAGNGIKPGGNADEGPFVTGNSPTDAFVPNTPDRQKSWLRSLPKTTQAPLFCLDNEPMLWHRSHRDAHPEGAKMQEVIAATKTYASVIRSIYSSAQIVGPEEWNYEGCFYSGYDAKRAAGLNYDSSRYPDRQQNGGQDWIPVYMKAMKAHYDQTHQRLIDYLGVHFYPHTPDNQTLLESDDFSPAMQTYRSRVTRSLWDATYQSEDYIKDFGEEGSRIRLIPRMKEWAALFPGTKTALTEYSFGSDNHINSALVQADALGIFGREGLDMACRWESPAPDSPVGKAFQLYRNYDGKGSGFGNVVQKCRVVGVSPDELSCFAASDGWGRRVTVVLISKKRSGAVTATVNLLGMRTSLGNRAVATAYRLEANGDPGKAKLAPFGSEAMITKEKLTVTLPAQTATLLVLRGVSK